MHYSMSATTYAVLKCTVINIRCARNQTHGCDKNDIFCKRALLGGSQSKPSVTKPRHGRGLFAKQDKGNCYQPDAVSIMEQLSKKI